MAAFKKTRLFETDPVHLSILKPGAPLLIASFYTLLGNNVGNILLSKMNTSLFAMVSFMSGTTELAAGILGSIFGIGTLCLMSRALGRKDHDTAATASAVGFYGSLLCAILLSAVCTVFRPQLLRLLIGPEALTDEFIIYCFWTVTLGMIPMTVSRVLFYQFLAVGDAIHAAVGQVVTALLKVALVIVLVLFHDMGAFGAGRALFYSDCGACLYYLIVIACRGGSGCVSIDPARLKKLKWKMAGESFKMGIPVALASLLAMVGTGIGNSLSSVDVFKFTSLSNTLCRVPESISRVMMMAVLPQAAYSYASGNTDRMKKCVLFAIKVALGISLAAILVYFVFGKDLIKPYIFMSNESAPAVRFLRCFCLVLPFSAFNGITLYTLLAAGKSRKGLLFVLLRELILLVPALIVLGKLSAEYGIACAHPAAECLLAILSAVLLRNLFSRAEQALSSSPE